ncbi:MAG: hypothetical protein HQ512_09610 [Rhodospirillales bacterium]|nr:hypothetical protein [Rhodospirillales bacterium]
MAQKKLTDRQFGLMMAAALLVIAAVGWFFFASIYKGVLIAAALFGLIGLVLPVALLPLNRLWGVFSEKLGAVTNFLLLGTFFYLFVMPFGLIIRLFGSDPMLRNPDAEAKTYWTPVARHTDKETLRDMF